MSIYGIGARFETARDLYEAAGKIREAGYKRWDVYSPFPIHGMDAAMGLKESAVSIFTLLAGIAAALGGLGLIVYASAINYPLVVQGKPYFAIEPAFPIIFEIVIIVSAFVTVGAVFALNLLPQLYHPVFNWERFSRVTDDGFFAVIESADVLFDETEVRRLLEKLGGTNIEMIGD